MYERKYLQRSVSVIPRLMEVIVPALFVPELLLERERSLPLLFFLSTLSGAGIFLRLQEKTVKTVPATVM